jgi:hypothetical protein
LPAAPPAGDLVLQVVRQGIVGLSGSFFSKVVNIPANLIQPRLGAVLYEFDKFTKLLQRFVLFLDDNRISLQEFYCFGLAKPHTHRIAAAQIAGDDCLIDAIATNPVERTCGRAFLT